MELEDTLRMITENTVLASQYPDMELDINFRVFENKLNLKHYLSLALSMALLYSGIQTKSILIPCSIVKTEEGDIILDPTQTQWDRALSKLFICFDLDQEEVVHMEHSSTHPQTYSEINELMDV